MPVNYRPGDIVGSQRSILANTRSMLTLMFYICCLNEPHVAGVVASSSSCSSLGF